MKKTGLYFSCQLGELLDDTFDVAEFTLTEGLSELFTLSLTLVSRRSDIDTDAQLLQKGSLTVKVSGEEQRTINGIIESIELGNSGFHRTWYYVTIRPEMWLLTLDQDSRIYHQSAVPDILKEILRQKGVTGNSRFLDAHHPREYVTMKRESSYDFFSRLAAEEGIAFWFNSDGRVYYSDSHLSMTAGIDVIYNPDARPVSEENVINRLRFGSRARPGETVHKDRNYGNPDYDLKHGAAAELGGIPGHSVFESYGRFQKDNVAKTFAQYRMEQLNADSKAGVAHSNCIRLMPGKIFKLSAHPVEAMNDRWQVVSAIHHGVQPAALEEESRGQGTFLTNKVNFIPGRNDWRPPYHYKPLADGDEVATVVGPKGEEIYVNEDGAVRVHFHWNRYDVADDTASCWVRVAQGWNGNGFGFLATPRIGQEVIISYLNGDIDRPIVTGCTYNGLNQPPLDLPAEKTRTTIKTKTHKGEGFNELRFDDEKGKQEVFIHAQKDMNTKVLDNRSTAVGTDHTETIGHDQTIEVKHDQKTTVTNDQTLLVEKNRQKTVNVSQKTEVKENDIESVGIKQAIEIGKLYELTVGDSLTIKVGESRLVMRKDGTIILKGIRILVDADKGIKNIADKINLN
ncbi:type VI secretion system tip protein TssI/VgrG [Erwinia sorbitola]|uniref:Type VI secretion system tip protein VgrG n=1 Tax=Erwinia sorbitola TaxID=2681984 RepID=A0A6I6ENH8_9GAMM|nr:type VI secretion system tip protein TssI/VgrG [Erwinia sorbitola]MTD28506.1 type VI secretion system tip protein VgrG [Erwinia sorbitola]QGU86619.1 type VI secretion system tip protein VgrG [Erwinia sorbitola]